MGSTGDVGMGEERLQLVGFFFFFFCRARDKTGGLDFNRRKEW